MKLRLKIAGIQPTVLRSRIAWFTWKSNIGAEAYGTPEWEKAPTFPCLAYSLQDRNGYILPHYLNQGDVEKMAAALEKAAAK